MTKLNKKRSTKHPKKWTQHLRRGTVPGTTENHAHNAMADRGRSSSSKNAPGNGKNATQLAKNSPRVSSSRWGPFLCGLTKMVSFWKVALEATCLTVLFGMIDSTEIEVKKWREIAKSCFSTLVVRKQEWKVKDSTKEYGVLYQSSKESWQNSKRIYKNVKISANWPKNAVKTQKNAIKHRNICIKRRENI